MTTVAAPPEQRIVLREVSWDTYERLLAERGETSTPRFAYDRGVLEIMSPGMAHERLDYLIGILVATLAEAWNIDVTGLGHLTYRNPAWEGGFEPDGCFYVGRAAAIRERSEIDARVDPPPDVVVEVDITSTASPSWRCSYGSGSLRCGGTTVSAPPSWSSAPPGTVRRPPAVLSPG